MTIQIFTENLYYTKLIPSKKRTHADFAYGYSFLECVNVDFIYILKKGYTRFGIPFSLCMNGRLFRCGHHLRCGGADLVICL